VVNPQKIAMRNSKINYNKYSILLDISPYFCHISSINFLTGGDMGYKQIDRNMTFAEVSLLKSMEHNRSLTKFEKINQVINWSTVGRDSNGLLYRRDQS